MTPLAARDVPPNVLGQIPLAHLDFVVDSKNRKLSPNPEHGDQQMSEEYGECANQDSLLTSERLLESADSFGYSQHHETFRHP